MNVQLKDITVTARDGRVSHLEQVYIRGSHVRYFIVPDMLRYGRRHTLGKILIFAAGMRPCSGLEVLGVGEWVSRAAVLQSIGQGGPGADAERGDCSMNIRQRLSGLRTMYEPLLSAADSRHAIGIATGNLDGDLNGG